MNGRMPFFFFFHRSLEPVILPISKFHLMLIIINSQSSSSSFTVRCSGWKEDSEKGALLQTYICVEREGKYSSTLFCNFPQWFGQLYTWDFLTSASSSGTIWGFLFAAWFFQRFNFYLKPRILSLEIKIFSPGPWRCSTTSCDKKKCHMK